MGEGGLSVPTSSTHLTPHLIVQILRSLPKAEARRVARDMADFIDLMIAAGFVGRWHFLS